MFTQPRQHSENTDMFKNVHVIETTSTFLQYMSHRVHLTAIVVESAAETAVQDSISTFVEVAT